MSAVQRDAIGLLKKGTSRETTSRPKQDMQAWKTAYASTAGDLHSPLAFLQDHLARLGATKSDGTNMNPSVGSDAPPPIAATCHSPLENHNLMLFNHYIEQDTPQLPILTLTDPAPPTNFQSMRNPSEVRAMVVNVIPSFFHPRQLFFMSDFEWLFRHCAKCNISELQPFPTTDRCYAEDRTMQTGEILAMEALDKLVTANERTVWQNCHLSFPSLRQRRPPLTAVYVQIVPSGPISPEPASRQP